MHVFASLVGYGVRLVPRAPFRLRRVSNPQGSVEVDWTREDGKVVRSRVIPSGDSCYQEPADGSADLVPFPESTGAWRIATSAFSITWPSGLVLQSTSTPDTPPGFDLVAQGDVLLWPQGVFPRATVGDVTRLVGPGQRMIRSGQRGGISFVELAYEHDGRIWYQRHDLVPFTADNALVLTVQAPEPRWSWASETAKEIAESAQEE